MISESWEVHSQATDWLATQSPAGIFTKPSVRKTIMTNTHKLEDSLDGWHMALMPSFGSIA